MHARDSVELAALIAVRARHQVAMKPLDAGGLQQYWVASKHRLDRWSHTLAAWPDETAGETAADGERRMRGVVEEILLSEMLTRVWTAVCVTQAARQQERDAVEVVENVLTRHLLLRQQALEWLIGGAGGWQQPAEVLNRLRRRNERWTDLLLASCADVCEVEPFCFSPARVRDCGAPSDGTSLDRDATFLIASLRASYPVHGWMEAAHPELNRQIAVSLLNCLQLEWFDLAGRLQTLWMERLEQTAVETEGLIAQLVADEQLPGSAS